MIMAAAYIRVSTEDQIEFSPDSQIKQIREYAKRNDMLLLDEYIFMDEGISGKNTKNRDAFNKMIGTAKSKPTPFEVILVWKFSRFARNREDSIVYKSMLRKQCGINVVSISESLGDDKTSILIEALIEAMDEYYSINLAEEVRRGMTEKASRGGVVSAPPYGYDIKNGVFVPNEKAENVKNIFNDFTGGMGMRAIATKYGSMGVRTTRGNLPDNRFIEYMLRNPVYIGKIRWCANGRGASKRDYDNPNNIVADAVHEPLISSEVFEAAQKRLADIKNMYGRYQRSEQPKEYMLKGLIRCSSCGSTLVMMSTKCPSLQCHSYSRGVCKVSHSISMNKAEKAVIKSMQDSVLSGEFDVVPKEHESREDNTQHLIDKENAKLKRAKLAYTEGVDTLEEYKQNKREIQRRISELKSSATVNTTFDLEAYKDKVKSILEILTDDSASPTTKNEALRLVVSNIIFQKDKQNLQLHYYI